MDGFTPAPSSGPPGASFGEAPLPARAFDPGMGLAVARRTILRAEDGEDFGRVADRVAAGNITLLGAAPAAAARIEQARLRNAIATGALITSGRHLQHGDAGQARRNMEVFTNCATAGATFTKFYLLLNGAGVGRAYDDDLCPVDWAEAPDLLLYLAPSHPDWPKDRAALHRFGVEFGLLRWGMGPDAFGDIEEADVRAFLAREMVHDLARVPADAIRHRIADTREGWAKAVEILEGMAFRRERGRTLLLDLSGVRPLGAPIKGMQGRPASGPLSLLRAFINLRREVIEASRDRDPDGEAMRPWEQALRADHILSTEVQVGGARRAARMATKSWRDPGALRFVRLKAEGGLWTANHSLMVDAEFWDRLGRNDEEPLTRHARALFAAATACAYVNGEPGFINGDRLEDARTGFARQKPATAEAGSSRYRVEEGAGLLAEVARRAASTHFPVTTNPCGEVVLHVTGGYCVISDFAPLLACPVPLDSLTPGAVEEQVARDWDARVEDAVRLGVRFLIRVNRMDALYGAEVARTNRIGIGPTGLHEWAWARFGLAFPDLVEEARSKPFWDALARLSAAAKEEATSYAASLGMAPPATVTTIKPAGTTSKLFGLTEGAHLPARRQYLRWVQFRGGPEGDPLIADYAARGYPTRDLETFPGVTIVGFPTLPLIQRLGIGDRLVTAPEASPEEQYHWLMLLERHWIGAERGNQVSYTLKIATDRVGLEDFRALLRDHQPHLRCCAVLPSRPDRDLGYEYLPEEEVDEARFRAIVAGIRDPGFAEAVDLARLQCEAGVCPI
ncbi:recombinase [Neoroseomonas oryzicola]|uniref:Recombinase n=1 Tax=Neoroseomonas oryzicola TaxID=535904 RepID=A0A9X9WDA2_9PROT|nr:recombinase [Neoroseomonas oryzicola]MBR0658312.1 recombinase [Neoroseomonas oryzicola]NKE18477.1 recombinase [Neoroseomonas oryzicola]